MQNELVFHITNFDGFLVMLSNILTSKWKLIFDLLQPQWKARIWAMHKKAARHICWGGFLKGEKKKPNQEKNQTTKLQNLFFCLNSSFF